MGGGRGERVSGLVFARLLCPEEVAALGCLSSEGSEQHPGQLGQFIMRDNDL